MEATSEEMKVGDGATYLMHTTRHAGTIIERTAKKIVWQQDKATLDPNFVPHFVPGGFAGHCDNQHEQRYTYERDPEGAKRVFTLRKNGYWKAQGATMNEPGCVLFPGRSEFYDYNF